MRGEYSALVAAAANGKGDEFSKTEKIENAMVKAAIEANEKKNRDAVQAQIMEVLGRADHYKQMYIDSIRDARREETAAKKNLDKLDKARAFAEKTGNFCPLLRLMGVMVPDANVPAEFKD